MFLRDAKAERKPTSERSIHPDWSRITDYIFITEHLRNPGKYFEERLLMTSHDLA
jgi:hypothetical protein